MHCGGIPDYAANYAVISYYAKFYDGIIDTSVVKGRSDTNAVKAYGPGVESNSLKEGNQTEFWVETAGAGESAFSIQYEAHTALSTI